MFLKEEMEYPFELIWRRWCEGLASLYEEDEATWWQRVRRLFDKSQFYKYDGVKYTIMLGILEHEIVILPTFGKSRYHVCYTDFVYWNGPDARHFEIE